MWCFGVVWGGVGGVGDVGLAHLLLHGVKLATVEHDPVGAAAEVPCLALVGAVPAHVLEMGPLGRLDGFFLAALNVEGGAGGRPRVLERGGTALSRKVE